MQGYQLTFFSPDDRLVHGRPLAQWLLEQVRDVGVRGATLIGADEGFGRDGRIHASHFFELSGRPQEITMALSQEEVDAVFALLADHGVDVFYALTPIEYGMSSQRGQ
ncbi:MAG: DUF190 domain-containing protein [Paludibacterium sp.]|uniref:DUF190 domain-containing protein n=1 Tax=Paludibacterium sp. TaxID=1917523 RepID=UPI0025EE5B3F|nr:DUF190 domain-containing protein [Paludibacterium sp.]MBV8045861.1 DUF190 domain-containing protein [Paludibacterium sp.]MBV8646779.1 DUF190 domain-containing protein [Paludibacterium sp.]